MILYHKKDINKMLKIWTDGSCLGNPGPGGWGFIATDGKNVAERCGGEKNTTSQNHVQKTKQTCLFHVVNDWHKYKLLSLMHPILFRHAHCAQTTPHPARWHALHQTFVVIVWH